MTPNEMLEALFLLTEQEKERDLTEKEKREYVNYWEILTFNGIDIPFGVNI